MKTTTIYLGVLATLFTTFTFANTIERADQNVETEVTKTINVLFTDNANGDLKKPTVNTEDEITFMDSIAIFGAKKQIAIEDTIEENKQITESQEEIVQPLYFERTIEDTIREDNQIIESNLVNETFPLDFQLIDKYENANKNADFKTPAFTKSNLKS